MINFKEVSSYLNTVIAGCYSSVLNLNIGWGMGKLALSVASSALLSLELPTHLKLEPPGVLLVEQRGHVDHGHGLRVDVGGVGHGGHCGH